MVVAYITASSREEALKIGKKLVEERLAACSNVLGGEMTSCYWWEGKVETATETVLIAKTSEKKSQQLIERVKSLHSYSCPCVILFPVVGGNEGYLNWLAENV